jgi:hypothetical protein
MDSRSRPDLEQRVLVGERFGRAEEGRPKDATKNAGETNGGIVHESLICNLPDPRMSASFREESSSMNIAVTLTCSNNGRRRARIQRKHTTGEEFQPKK